MDPNATLARINELTARILERPFTIKTYSDVPSDRYDLLDDAQELAGAVGDLNLWIAAGGFLPDAWIGS